MSSTSGRPRGIAVEQLLDERPLMVYRSMRRRMLLFTMKPSVL